MISTFFPTTRVVSEYNMTQDIVKNPLMGFAPRAESPGLVSDNTLVYVDITLRELEPEENNFAFKTIEAENYFDKYRKEGRHAVLRLVNDFPGSEKHLDIPDWLFEKTGRDGTFYDNAYGKGYAPNYNNPILIEHHKLALEALGRRYGKDTFISYIQLGSLGHWGEWHIHQNSDLPTIPRESIRSLYVKPYIEAFPHAKILMRRPFTCAKENQFGLYNDMIGHTQSTRQWMEWIEQGGRYEQTEEDWALVPMPDIWEKAPIGGELTSAIPMSQLLTTHLSQTRHMLTDAHTTFIGPKIPEKFYMNENRYSDGILNLLQSIGYRLGITKVVWSETFRSTIKIKLTWENSGVSPIYWDWPVYVYFTGSNEEFLDKIQVELALTDVLPGKKVKTLTEFKTTNGRKNAQAVYIGIEDPMTNHPAVKLVSSQEKLGNLSLIKRWREIETTTISF